MTLHRRQHWNKRTGAGARTVLIILAIVAALLVVGCLACAGLTYFGFTGMVDEAIKEQYNGNPVIEQHIGEIESASVSIAATQEAQQEFGSDDYIVILVSGPKGEGKLILHRPEGESFRSTDAVLRTSEGDFDLFPGFQMPSDIDTSQMDRAIEQATRRSLEMRQTSPGPPSSNRTGLNPADSESNTREAPYSPPRFPTPSNPSDADETPSSSGFPAPSQPESAPSRPPAFPRPTD